MFQNFKSLTYTHKSLCILIHHFTSCTSTCLYISTYSPSCHLMSNTQTKNFFIYFQSFDDTYQALTLLSHLILTYMSWLQPKEEDLHFQLSDNGNYNFDVKIIKCNLSYFLSLCK